MGVIEIRIKAGDYPDIEGIVLKDTISKCWKGEFLSARDVARNIEQQGAGTGQEEGGRGRGFEHLEGEIKEHQQEHDQAAQ